MMIRTETRIADAVHSMGQKYLGGAQFSHSAFTLSTSLVQYGHASVILAMKIQRSTAFYYCFHLHKIRLIIGGATA